MLGHAFAAHNVEQIRRMYWRGLGRVIAQGIRLRGVDSQHVCVSYEKRHVLRDPSLS